MIAELIEEFCAQAAKRQAGTVHALGIGMRQTTLRGGRVCAMCGKDMGQGQAPAGAALLVKWLKEAGIRLRAPESNYLDLRCARKHQGRRLPERNRT